MNSIKVILIPVLLFFILLSCSREKTNNTDIANTKKSVIEPPVSIPDYMDAALNGNSDKVKEFITEMNLSPTIAIQLMKMEVQL